MKNHAQINLKIDDALAQNDPEFEEIRNRFLNEVAAANHQLSKREQLLCILAVLIGCQGLSMYLGNSDADHVSDDVALAVMRNTVINMRRVHADMNDIQARSNLMWDSAMAENGILKVGRLTDFQAHQIEHQLGAYTDCNHGQGLAVIQPVYYRHILKDAEQKFERIAKAVFDVDGAEAGLDALDALIAACGLPRRLSQLRSAIPMTTDVLRKVADSSNIVKTNPRELSRDEIYELLCECL